MKGEEVAKKTLQKLRQTDDVSEELDLMKGAIASESGGPVVSIRDVFKERKHAFVASDNFTLSNKNAYAPRYIVASFSTRIRNQRHFCNLIFL